MTLDMGLAVVAVVAALTSIAVSAYAARGHYLDRQAWRQSVPQIRAGARAEEREACARLAEAPAVTGDADDCVQATAFGIAAAIRARGEGPWSR